MHGVGSSLKVPSELRTIAGLVTALMAPKIRETRSTSTLYITHGTNGSRWRAENSTEKDAEDEHDEKKEREQKTEKDIFHMSPLSKNDPKDNGPEDRTEAEAQRDQTVYFKFRHLVFSTG